MTISVRGRVDKSVESFVLGTFNVKNVETNTL